MIKFTNVDKVWPNGKHVLKNINLTIEEGEFVAVIGPSGAGKTTLLKTINQINIISSGNILVKIKENDGTHKEYDLSSINGKELRALRTKIGLMSQEYNNLEKQTVLQNVLNSRVAKLPWYRVFLGFFTKKEKVEALKALDKLSLLDYAYTRAGNLSGGQQQRVALARTINQNPSIIIADEPVSALDPILANQVMLDFQKINQELNMTVIINIHHVDLAVKYCRRIIGLNDGKVVFDGTPQQLTEAKLKEIYGGNY
ncbi:phosphonate ABC transporter ATP-binding protein [Mesoplasma seiffertii]|uniref:phosphonate ABC transporter ATP-binding protein n=1 Tax=Mesoplasma seiffertii TaxID=28224 RepID=UPI00047BDD5D|nr:phosphonate ABC transporter ATP-binding protein [Mesoplasma seiffertii]